MNLNIVYEDKYILCLEKPQGIPSQSDKTNDEDLMSAAIEYLKMKEEKPYLGLIQRLDRPVGGVIVYAKTEFANKELSKQVQQRETQKEYLAVVCGKPESEKAILEDYLKKLKTINMSKVTTSDDKQGKLAKLEYEAIGTVQTEEYGTLSLLKINLHTGRHHQIRVQLSNAKLPIWGDNKYNKTFMKKKEFTYIALWSHKFGFKHPKTKKYIEFASNLPNTYPFNLFNNINWICKLNKAVKNMITYEDIKNSKEIQTYIKKADDSLIELGYTEHSFAHVGKVAAQAQDILLKLGYDERTAELARIAGYMHDIGNVVNRVDHAQSSAIMAFRILDKMGMDVAEIATIISAIGNHDEATAVPVNEVAAALMLADKSDVRRSRVRNTDQATFDIHDRVNYSVESSNLEIDPENKYSVLELKIDTNLFSIMDYFEIFLGRMLLCRRASEFLKLRFKLVINGVELL